MIVVDLAKDETVTLPPPKLREPCKRGSGKPVRAERRGEGLQTVITIISSQQTWAHPRPTLDPQSVMEAARAHGILCFTAELLDNDRVWERNRCL